VGVLPQRRVFLGARAVADALDMQATDGAPDAEGAGCLAGMGGGVKTEPSRLLIDFFEQFWGIFLL